MMNAPEAPKRGAAALRGPSPAPAEPPLISSAQLFAGGNAVRIEHNGQIYLLRVTRENRLILTK